MQEPPKDAVQWPVGMLRQRERGLTRRLVSLTTDIAAWPHGHNPIYRNGQLAGEVTSAAYSPTLSQSVALSWIEQGSVKSDDLLSDRFEVEVAGTRYPADVHVRAPFDPDGTRMRA
ncbi:glycine cleavage T C-terminal barrel domain-containing protein [uncultured Tateyamaria sp.]|nr:glycine cleavage T C-terminal barrel domain-containing protein [uncultured Tateyamaria sp.]